RSWSIHPLTESSPPMTACSADKREEQVIAQFYVHPRRPARTARPPRARALRGWLFRSWPQAASLGGPQARPLVATNPGHTQTRTAIAAQAPSRKSGGSAARSAMRKGAEGLSEGFVIFTGRTLARSVGERDNAALHSSFFCRVMARARPES